MVFVSFHHSERGVAISTITMPIFCCVFFLDPPFITPHPSLIYRAGAGNNTSRWVSLKTTHLNRVTYPALIFRWSGTQRAFAEQATRSHARFTGYSQSLVWSSALAKACKVNIGVGTCSPWRRPFPQCILSRSPLACILAHRVVGFMMLHKYSRVRARF